MEWAWLLPPAPVTLVPVPRLPFSPDEVTIIPSVSMYDQCVCVHKQAVSLVWRVGGVLTKQSVSVFFHCLLDVIAACVCMC